MSFLKPTHCGREARFSRYTDRLLLGAKPRVSTGFRILRKIGDLENARFPHWKFQISKPQIGPPSGAGGLARCNLRFRNFGISNAGIVHFRDLQYGLRSKAVNSSAK